MGPDRKTDWPKPTIDEAIDAGMVIGNYYGTPFSRIDVGNPVAHEPLTDQKAEQRLLDLADHIMDGTVNSHVAIARVVRSLGPKMGPMGSASTEIDLAAFRISHAVRLKQSTFQENK